LALVDDEVAFVLAFMATVCPEHILKSEPAFAVGDGITLTSM
jgi:hypothetical protein